MSGPDSDRATRWATQVTHNRAKGEQGMRIRQIAAPFVVATLLLAACGGDDDDSASNKSNNEESGGGGGDNTGTVNVTVTGFENVDASGSSAAVTLTGSSGVNVLIGNASTVTSALPVPLKSST